MLRVNNLIVGKTGISWGGISSMSVSQRSSVGSISVRQWSGGDSVTVGSISWGGISSMSISQRSSDGLGDWGSIGNWGNSLGSVSVSESWGSVLMLYREFVVK
jgi:hypothetical protein